MNIKSILVGLILVGISTTSIAAPNDKANDHAKKGKTPIAHCGCNDDNNDLIWKELDVSANAIGHKNHIGNTFANCTDDIEFPNLLERAEGASDCALDDGNNPLELTVCDLDFSTTDEGGEPISCMADEQPDCEPGSVWDTGEGECVYED